MKDTAPNSYGVLAVAALFGIVAFAVSYLVLDFAGFASFLIGAIVAIITAIVLWLGWREPAAGPTGPRQQSADATATASSAAPAAAAPTPAPTTAASAAAPAAAATASAPAPAAVAASPAPAAAPAAKPKAAPAAKKAAPAKTAAPAKKAAPAKAAAKPAEKAAPARKPVAADGKPEMMSKPRGGAGDDLKQIKGVGPKLEKMLNGMGVWHFDQVAGWRKKEVEWVDENLEGFKGRVSRDEWVKQAKVLAKGGTTDFSKKVKKGGVY
ncbi:NADH:quinone oxidoreductase [Pseudooctadecabacter sp.]|uniref:NADH:quinone oxidoreductase n=1 Tax=Pseudooctadecabacter sp. TaxID=1966338 RepID=UPI003F6BE1EE